MSPLSKGGFIKIKSLRLPIRVYEQLSTTEASTALKVTTPYKGL